MSNTVFLQGKSVRKDDSFDSLWTKERLVKDSPLPHHVAGLSFTRTGYGSRIPTRQKVFFNGKWRRIYCRVFSNTGTRYLRTTDKSEVIIVQ